MAVTKTGNLGISQGQAGRPHISICKSERKGSGWAGSPCMCIAWVCRREVISAPMKTAVVHPRKPHRGLLVSNKPVNHKAAARGRTRSESIVKTDSFKPRMPVA
eukprot:5045461-Pleurochrysis_carterae.AAC.1